MLKKLFLTGFVLLTIFSKSYAVHLHKLLVQLDKNVTIESIFTKTKLEITSHRLILESLNLYAIQVSSDKTLQEITDNINRIDGVLAAHQDHKVSGNRGTPNDTLFIKQWDLSRIGVQSVWQYTQGGTTVNNDTIVVGIVEPGGYNFRHPDLFPNIWKNHAEIPNNKIDDDKNGYIDDYFGLNIKTKNDKHEEGSHGTGVAGIIGARGNNTLGVTGVNWYVKILLVSEAGWESEIIEGYNYMIKQRKLYNETKGKKGTFVVASNASFGFRGLGVKDMPLFCELYNELGKVGILSVAATDNLIADVDKTLDIPSNCPSDYLIVLTNTNKKDSLYRDGNGAAWGKTSVDLTAPGQESFTTRGDNSYGNFGGCSAATPHVAGAIALFYSLAIPELTKDAFTNPSKNLLLLKNVMMDGAKPIDDLKGRTVSGGRLDLKNSLALLIDSLSTDNILVINKLFPNPSKNTVNVNFSTSNLYEYTLECYDTSGKRVYCTNDFPNLNENQVKIDVSNWTSGVYIVKIKSEKLFSVVKFIKL